MGKRALRKDILREIKKRFNQFLSIMIILTLGIGFFIGIRVTGADMRITGDQYFDEQKLMDIRLLSTLGFDDDSLKKIKSLSSIEAVFPSYSVDTKSLVNGNEYLTHNMALPEGDDAMNLPVLEEGRMPQNSQECVVDATMLRSGEIKLGDRMMLKTENDELKQQYYTIVGSVISPQYIALDHGYTSIGDGKLDSVVFVPRDAFDLDYYTEVYLLVKGASELSCFSDEYDDLIERSSDELDSIKSSLSELRIETIKEPLIEKLEKGQKEYDENKAKAEKELDDAKRQLDDAKKQLDGAKSTLSSSGPQLESSKKQLEDSKRQLDETLKRLDSAKADLDAGRQQLDAGKSQFDAALSEIYKQLGTSVPSYGTNYEGAVQQLKKDVSAFAAAAEKQLSDAYKDLEEFIKENPTMTDFYEEQKTQLDGQAAAAAEAKTQLDQAVQKLESSTSALSKAQSEYDAGLRQYREGQDAYQTGLAQYKDGLKEYNAGVTAYENGQAEYRSGLAEYEAGLKEYETQKSGAERRLSEAEKQLDDGRRELSKIESPTIYIQNRSANPSYSGFPQDSDRIEAIGRVFPLIFFLVAALVCLTTITRMVEEQRMQMGTLKALGYSPKSVAVKYILFALSAGVLALIFGMLFGYNLLPVMIYNAYRTLYQMPPLVHPFDISFAVLPALLSVVCTVLTALAACKLELRSAPAKLMRPAAPKPGKRILLERFTPVWKRLPFLEKVTARNLFRSKGRFWMSVLGIAGCTGLLITALGLNNSIMSMVDKQYDELNLYQMQVGISPKASQYEIDQLYDALDKSELVTDYLSVDSRSADASSGGKTYGISLIVVPDGTDLSSFLPMRERQSSETFTLKDDGIVIDEKLSLLLGVKVGDTITIANPDDNLQAQVKISAIKENYILHYGYVTASFYEQLTGFEPLNNLIYCKSPTITDDSFSDTSGKLLKLNAAESVVRVDTIRGSFDDMMKSFQSIIWIVIIAAAILALVVLHNLSTINISERIRELATIKVLGFYNGETSAYIYRENIVLTLIGIVMGCVFGVFLHSFVIQTAEIDLVMFIRTLDAPSVLTAILLTILFSALVNLILHFRLKKIDMVEALKSVE
ncbi:FtsX-like permease family protein [Candidatus Soleaferrea massiliensis]|uniref:FtsX-like permease family protein n=1 Tax=Candidatus Soleaferrea massiliensis TaxID=1470354 RepID=UPI000A6FB72B|nr:FtsX-like permease family protein [Candidatus Soleaferrea massiliensis]